MCADEIQTTAIAGAGENIETGFKPVVKAVGDLNGLVPGVIRRQRAVIGGLRSLHREVVVEFDHSYAARNSFRSVDLNLVVALGVSIAGEKRDESQVDN